MNNHPILLPAEQTVDFPTTTFDSGNAFSVTNTSNNARCGVKGAVTGTGTGNGVIGSAGATGNGVYGIGNYGPGVCGESNQKHGVLGVSYTSGYAAVKGAAQGGAVGVVGDSPNANGVEGYAHQPTKAAVYAGNTNGGPSIAADGNVYVNGTISSSSDERLKDDIKAMDDGALETAVSIMPITFRRKSTGDRSAPREVGFSAQDLATKFPHAVSYRPETSDMYVDHAAMLALAFKAIQELTAKVAILENK